MGNTDRVHGKFCKKVLRISRSAARMSAKGDLGREGRSGQILSAATKYWDRVKHSLNQLPMRHCYKWQVGQPMVECWAQKLRVEQDRIGLGWAMC
jgi:hypothetical protein